MDQLFSFECKSLISKSREIAINLGYDYISTVHFFLADCENDSPTSIRKFAFGDNDNEYLKFKKGYTLNEINYLDHIDDSIPLTKEAESAIRLGEKERLATGHDMTYPFHILIGCFKAENSVLADCFKNNTTVIDNLMKYYKDLVNLEPKTTTVNEIMSKQTNPLKSLLRIFKK